MNTPQTQHRTHHRVLIVGGGTAGITVAARLRRAGVTDIGLVEPSETHYYQPLWTLVGGGRAGAGESARPQRNVIPNGVAWTKAAAETVDPDQQVVTTDTGAELSYDYLVMAPGIQLDWDKVPGMAEALQTPFVSSNYSIDLAPKTWDRIQQLRSGTAVFTQPAGLIKCAGAPQKIAYLAADHWRREGVLNDIDIHLVLPTPGMFGVKVFADELERVVQRYGITVHTNSEVVEVDAASRHAMVTDHSTGAQQALGYDFMHMVPPQSAPDWVKRSALSDPGEPRRLPRGRQVHPPTRPLPQRVRAGGCRLDPELQDRCRRPQAGPRRRQQPARHHGRPAGQRPVRRVRLLPDHHRPEQDAARRVRLHHAAAPHHPAHRHHQGAQGHVAAQAVRPPRPLLEPDAHGKSLTEPTSPSTLTGAES